MNIKQLQVLKKFMCILSLGFTLSGCTTFTYVKLQSNYISAPQDQKMPEIITTQAYQAINKQNISVVVKAPDQCTSYTADQRTGNADAGETILKTDCGLEMAEIERGLARIGYRVISWKAFNQQIDIDRNLTKAAQNLGVEIIFQINSLENSVKNLGQDARWERSYYLTDYMGNTIKPFNLMKEERSVLAKKFIVSLEEKHQENSYSVTIDASAIQVSTGQTIWYYRWAKASEPETEDKTISSNIFCDTSMSLNYCQEYTPRNPRTPQVNLASGDTIGISKTEKPADIAKAEYSRLYREVVKNFVESFSQGKTY